MGIYFLVLNYWLMLVNQRGLIIIFSFEFIDDFRFLYIILNLKLYKQYCLNRVDKKINKKNMDVGNGFVGSRQGCQGQRGNCKDGGGVIGVERRLQKFDGKVIRIFIYMYKIVNRINLINKVNLLSYIVYIKMKLF